MEYEIYFSCEGKKIRVEAGTTILEAERWAGLTPDAPCGGQGACGKCMVTLRKGEKTEKVKACQYPVFSDLTVETTGKPEDHVILTQGRSGKQILSPVIRGGFVKFRKLRLGEPYSQWERILEALEETFGSLPELEPDGELASSLYNKLRKTDTWYVVLGEKKILSMTAEKVPVYGAAIDIGTTSVVGYLLNLESGTVLGVESRINPQSQYGADVIMRCNYASERGIKPLSSCIRRCLGEILTALSEKQGISLQNIYGISVVGNTCMHHLLLGLHPDSLSHAPYNPVIREQLTVSAESLDLPAAAEAEVYLLPNIAGFVGADTVGCLLCTHPDQDPEISLMIDIGTNGEMVLGSRAGLVTCSTAAGPAFEGAKIECGMRGAAGAIDHVSCENGVFSYTTVKNEKPVGICGSGLIDLTACMLKAGLIDEMGAMDLPDESQKFVLVPAEESGTGREIYLSQRDIREVQLAKAAIAAGITLLCKALKITLSDISKVYIAGAFGNYMDADSACAIGLIPPVLCEKIHPIGNAAGEGAKLALLNREELRNSQSLSRKISFVELASSPDFQDCFVDELEFVPSED